ncbi:MAG: hypothetical protein ACXVUE_09610 [Solirubrobacteraceae bacterium]
MSSEALDVGGSDEWPAVSVKRTLTNSGDLTEVARVGEQTASIQTPSARLRLDRRSSTLEIRSSDGVPVADLVHPALWPAAAVFARWHGRETFHAGAVSFDGEGAWAILGERGAGKSSLLAILASHGVEVLGDDLVVVAGQRCFGGPRCIDLRPEAAAALSIERDTRLVRSTERRRLMLGPCNGEYTLRGFVQLRWGTEVGLQRLLPAERLPLLLDHRRVVGLGADFEQLLDLVALPAVRLIRPPGWHASQRVASELGEHLSQSTKAPAAC